MRVLSMLDIRLWCMCFEAKHQQLKKEARHTSFKNNICLTLSKFQQRLHAYNIQCNESFATVLTANSTGKLYTLFINDWDIYMCNP